jgi:ubiquinone biosynthesis monooxygenase Coq6
MLRSPFLAASLIFIQLPNDQASLVWSTRPAVAAAVRKLGPDTLSALVNAAFRLPFDSIAFLYMRLLDEAVTEDQLRHDIAWRSSYDVAGPESTPSVFSNDIPPEVTSVQPGSVASFPYRFSHATSYIGEPPLGEHLPSRTVLVGDAAHSMHPLAGQGLNTGLGDVESLSNSIDVALREGQDPGTVLALRQYSRERYLANHLLMSGVDHLHKLYGNESRLLVWARSAGLEIVNESSTLRSFFMKRAGATDGPERTGSPLASVTASAVKVGSLATQMLGRAAGLIANRVLDARGSK